MNNAPDLEKVIDSDRHKITGFINRGCWGAVYEAEDLLTGEKVAIKVLDPNDLAKQQASDRNLDTAKAMKKEGGKLIPLANVIPRFSFVDKNEKPYIVMPKYNTFLDTVLCDYGKRNFLSRNLSHETISLYLSSLANGLREIHTVMKRVHGDIKPDNIAVDGDNLLLNDLGTSTCASTGRSVSPRDNMGCLYTRAPECFKKDSHPEKCSDVWAFGSLAYRLLTGKYIFEDELNNSVDPIIFMSRLEPEVANAMIKNRLKSVPRKFRKLLFDCLNFYSYERIKDGAELKHRVDQTIESLNVWKAWKNHSKTALVGTLPILAASLLAYMAATYEPETTKHDSPQNVIYPKEKINEKPLEFDMEELELPAPMPHRFVLDQSWINRVTNDRYVAFLLKTYHKATFACVVGQAPTAAQTNVYLANTSETERKTPIISEIMDTIFKNIEDALTKSKNPEGKIDLEDVCAIARLGVDKVDEARRAAKSLDFAQYITAKDSNGDYIIPEKEQQFLKTWLSYIRE